MEEMPSLNMPVQRLKVAILPLDLTSSGPVTNSGEILTTGKSRGKKNNSSRDEIHENNSRIHLDRLENKCTNCKGVKNNINFGQITGIQEKLDTKCK